MGHVPSPLSPEPRPPGSTDPNKERIALQTGKVETALITKDEQAKIEKADQAKSDKQAYKDWKREKGIFLQSREASIRDAARDSHVESTRYLISKGWGPQTLRWAITNDEETAVKTLIEAGCDLEDIRADDQSTALMKALSWRRFSIAKALIEAGADVNAKNKQGETVLEVAVRCGERSVSLLIEAGVNLDAKGSRDRTALEWAEESGRVEIAAILKKAAGQAESLKVKKSTDRWTVFNKNGSQMVVHVQYDAASTVRMTDTFNFSTRMLLAAFKIGDEDTSLTAVHFKDIDPAVLEDVKARVAFAPLLKRPRPPACS